MGPRDQPTRLRVMRGEATPQGRFQQCEIWQAIGCGCAFENSLATMSIPLCLVGKDFTAERAELAEKLFDGRVGEMPFHDSH